MRVQTLVALRLSFRHHILYLLAGLGRYFPHPRRDLVSRLDYCLDNRPQKLPHRRQEFRNQRDTGSDQYAWNQFGFQDGHCGPDYRRRSRICGYYCDDQ